MSELFKTRLRAAICAPRIPTCAHFHMGSKTILQSKMVSNVSCKGNINCSQKGQLSHAALEGVEGEGRIVIMSPIINS